jgi:hypothetical protein
VLPRLTLRTTIRVNLPTSTSACHQPTHPPLHMSMLTAVFRLCRTALRPSAYTWGLRRHTGVLVFWLPL